MSFYMAEVHSYYVVPYVSHSTCFSDKGQHTGFNSDQCQVPVSQSIDTAYRFYDFDKCYKYDAFFEREDPFIKSIAGIETERICIDLNGLKYDFSGYDAVLTTKTLNLECIREYGINMEPIEMNIIYQVHGNTIKLYKLKNNTEMNMFNELHTPYSCKERIFHQIGKLGLKNILSICGEKIKKKLKR